VSFIITIQLGFYSNSQVDIVYESRSLSDYIDLTELNDSIKFKYEGYEYKDFYFTEVTLTNTGSRDISRNDFEGNPFIIFSNKKVHFIKLDKLESNTPDFQSHILINGDSVIINPIMIKQDEILKFEIVSSKIQTMFLPKISQIDLFI
jgi:hypothetical protein